MGAPPKHRAVGTQPVPQKWRTMDPPQVQDCSLVPPSLRRASKRIPGVRGRRSSPGRRDPTWPSENRMFPFRPLPDPRLAPSPPARGPDAPTGRIPTGGRAARGPTPPTSSGGPGVSAPASFKRDGLRSGRSSRRAVFFQGPRCPRGCSSTRYVASFWGGCAASSAARLQINYLSAHRGTRARHSCGLTTTDPAYVPWSWRSRARGFPC